MITSFILQLSFSYLESRHDLQTLAMICLLISKLETDTERIQSCSVTSSRTKEISLSAGCLEEVLLSRDKSLVRSNSDLQSEKHRNILPRTVSSSSIYLSPYTATANILAATVSSVMGASNSTYGRQNSISYAAAVRNNPDKQSKTILKIKTYLKNPQQLNLFETIDQAGKSVPNLKKLQAVSSYSYRYAETLYSWRLWYLRTEILKSLTTTYNFIPEDELRIGLFRMI